MIGALFFNILEALLMHWQYIIVLLFTFALIFVNGIFDGSSTIATIIATRATKISTAIIISVIFNFLGVLALFFFQNNISETLLSLMEFSTNGTLILSTILFTILLFTIVAYLFEYIVSFSQALLAVLIGVSLAFDQSVFALDTKLLRVVLLASIIFPLFASVLASIIVKLNVFIFKGLNKRYMDTLFRYKQILSGAVMSFMHGFIDGQKFLVFFILLSHFKSDYAYLSDFLGSLSFVIIVSLIMSIGSALGGFLVIRRLGMDLVKVVDYEAYSADLSALLILFMACYSGMPISVKQSKTMGLIGVGFSKQAHKINFKLVFSLIKTWLITFPICIVLGYLLSKVLIIFVL